MLELQILSEAEGEREKDLWRGPEITPGDSPGCVWGEGVHPERDTHPLARGHRAALPQRPRPDTWTGDGAESRAQTAVRQERCPSKSKEGLTP